MTAAQLALLLTAGFLAGLVNAVAGGGTLLTFPALLATGLSPVSANVTNTVAIWPGYLSGAATYRAELRRDRRRLVELAAVSIIGAIGGTIALLTAPAAVFKALVPYLVLGATLVLAVQPMLTARLAERARLRAAPDDRSRVGGAERPASWRLSVAIMVGAAYGAYFGGGLGIILLAVLAVGTGEMLSRVNGLKTALSLLINTVALLGFAAFGPVDWRAVLVIAPASLMGGFVGGRIAQWLSPTVLRRLVVVFGLGVGGYLWWRQNIG